MLVEWLARPTHSSEVMGSIPGFPVWSLLYTFLNML